MADGKFNDRKAALSPMEYQVVVNKVTERPYSNKYNRHWEAGTYHCIVCNQELFKSESKFESKSGWPAFSSVIQNDRVKLKADTSNVGMNLLLLATRPDLARTEVSCSVCGAHLGHLFKDGPKAHGGLRYCINSSSLSFSSVLSDSGVISVTTGIHPDSSVAPAAITPCGIGKMCFFASRKEDSGGSAIQRISTAPRPLPILRETTL